MITCVLNLSQLIFKYILVLHEQCKNITLYTCNYHLLTFCTLPYILLLHAFYIFITFNLKNQSFSEI